MLSKGYINYKQELARVLTEVDDSLSNGGSMTAIEWFDFNTKSFLLGYKSKNMRLYKLLNSKYVKLAEIYAEALSFAVDIGTRGFSMDIYEEIVKYLAGKLNKLIRGTNKVSVKFYDRNGKFYISVGTGRGKVVDYPIDSKEEAQKWVINVVRYSTDLIDVINLSREFRKYLNGYLAGEIRRINACLSPIPYIEYSRVEDIRSVGAVTA